MEKWDQIVFIDYLSKQLDESTLNRFGPYIAKADWLEITYLVQDLLEDIHVLLDSEVIYFKDGSMKPKETDIWSTDDESYSDI